MEIALVQTLERNSRMIFSCYGCQNTRCGVAASRTGCGRARPRGLRDGLTVLLLFPNMPAVISRRSSASGKARSWLCRTRSVNRIAPSMIRQLSRMSPGATGSSSPISCTLGITSHTKNVGALMAAFARVPAHLRNSHQLVLAGDLGPFAAERRQLATDLSLTGQAHFAGRIAEGDMPALYSGALLFAFPSLYEGFGLPPLEAMACGTAVVSSNRSSLPEVVGDAGCLVDPDDVPALATAIHRLIEDEGERSSMEARGLQRAAEFRSEVICELQMRIAEGVVAGDNDG